MVLWRLLISTLAFHKVRCALTITAIALAISLVVAVTSGYSSGEAAVQQFVRYYVGASNIEISPKGDTHQVFGEELTARIAEDGATQVVAGRLVSSLPITVSGLNDRWSAYLYDRALKKARPVGVFEGKAWATVCLNGKLDVFIGHPVVCDRQEVMIQTTQTGEKSWAVEVHNPTDGPMRVTVKKNAHFDPLRASRFVEKALDVPAGQSVFVKMD